MGSHDTAAAVNDYDWYAIAPKFPGGPFPDSLSCAGDSTLRIHANSLILILQNDHGPSASKPCFAVLSTALAANQLLSDLPYLIHSPPYF